ncbi:peptidyl-prolyl cis-trans isomerase CYP63 [Nicotiana tomentosiformis]|uniref:peptidyl-prolyl cis-trans isomerase CYP63 n=1 Tax=Nicotiana tomentosiformis TaxID=4098 RepID=UPI00051B8E3F|nr:uncharacterized protein LOC104113246 [Nicotiana tomentosiformis]
MGCCFSSSKKHHRNPLPCSASNDRAPPQPPPLEEETVKEVLSETPIPKPHHPPKVPLVNDKEADFPQVKIESTAVVKPTSDETTFEATVVVKPCDDTKFESTAVIKPEVSEEPSEMCSFTESYSTTATATEKREDDGEVTQRSPIRVYRKRQNSGEIPGVRERSFRSQPGRSAPSPEKRRSPASSRGVQGRGMTAQRRNVGPPNGGTRRGTIDSGVRRSKSPATRGPVEQRRNVRYRSPAAREEEKLGGQSPVRSAENGGSSRAEKPKEEVSPESGESLENPLVSMECFIFL